MSLPLATYRVQLHAGFPFVAAAHIAAYLAKLGISHLYTSPFLKARTGSTHGYDIVAHDELNPELGGTRGFAALINELQRHHLKLLADFVPNHMGVGGADNPLWLEVLEWGRDSYYAGWFDIDWQPNYQYLHGKVLVPFLGNQYGIELEAGQLVLKFDAAAGEFAVWAYDAHKLPICPLHYKAILGADDDELERLGDDFAAITEWRPQLVRRATELKQVLAATVARNVHASEALAHRLARINGESIASQQNDGQVETAARPLLHELIQLQHWRATHFRVAGDDINYRRFFNINDLAGLRIELPEVFEHAHRLMLQLMARGEVDGLRIDHIDGLLDPAAYLVRLRTALATLAAPAKDTEAQPIVSTSDIAPNDSYVDSYVVVEKILSPGEVLPDSWPVAGTTGYEFCNLVLGMLIDPAGEAALSQCYVAATGEPLSFASIVRDSKLRIMNNEMAGELNVLARDAARVARQTPRTADFTRNILLRAIREVVACLAVYRTYLDANAPLTASDRARIQAAVDAARRHEREIDPSVFDFLQQLLCGDLITARLGFVRHTVLRCAMKLQQYSGPVMAKGQEDTAYFRFNRFIALNEVGGHPEQFAVSVAEFHRENLYRAQHWPQCMLSTATHDTKLGEDARARLAVLSELAEVWQQHVLAWNNELGVQPDSPHRNEIYLCYQLLMATWPLELTAPAPLDAQQVSNYLQRLAPVLRKCMREAKLYSTWANPDTTHEDQLLSWLGDALQPQTSPFLTSFLSLQARVAQLAVSNSVAQTVLKFTVPGVPDLYQGAELWQLSMVDPDNRAPVDFTRREQMLEQISSAIAGNCTAAMRGYWREWRDGQIKLALIRTLLALRRAHVALFAMGSYEPCEVFGPDADVLCVFLRRHAAHTLLIAVRRFATRANFTESTWVQLPESLRQQRWRDVLTEQVHQADTQLRVAPLFAVLPVVVLEHHRATSI